MRTMWILSTIRRANIAAGGHWFDRSTLRFFNSRVYRTVYQGPGGVYFVSWESYDGINGDFTVRQFNPDTGDVRTYGDIMSHKTRKAAVGLQGKPRA